MEALVEMGLAGQEGGGEVGERHHDGQRRQHPAAARAVRRRHGPQRNQRVEQRVAPQGRGRGARAAVGDVRAAAAEHEGPELADQERRLARLIGRRQLLFSAEPRGERGSHVAAERRRYSAWVRRGPERGADDGVVGGEGLRGDHPLREAAPARVVPIRAGRGELRGVEEDPVLEVHVGPVQHLRVADGLLQLRLEERARAEGGPHVGDFGIRPARAQSQAAQVLAKAGRVEDGRAGRVGVQPHDEHVRRIPLLGQAVDSGEHRAGRAAGAVAVK